MRIVQINGGAKGSTGKTMMGIAEVARAQGHEVMCASPITTTNRDAGEDCGYYRIGTFNSRRLNVALARITGFNGCFAWFETYKLLKKIDEFKPDIIHLHNLHDSYINLPMLFSYIKKHNVPTVWTLHDCWAFTGQCPHFTIVKCDKWKAGCHNCPQYKGYGCGTIQMEDLKEIRNGTENKFLKDWTYFDLRTKIKYKAEEYGIELKLVNPQYTSQRCSQCGYIDKQNRPKEEKGQAFFQCMKCGFSINADYNASVNLATKDIDKIIQKELRAKSKQTQEP